MSITFNDSDLGYMDPEFSDYVWDRETKEFIHKDVLSKRGFNRTEELGGNIGESSIPLHNVSGSVSGTEGTFDE
jgi:hypothetical protein